MGAPVDREKMLGIVKDFFVIKCDLLPSEADIKDKHRAQLLELRDTIVSRTAATQALGPVFAELQAKAEECLNEVGDELERLSGCMGFVEAAIAQVAEVGSGTEG